MLKVLKKIVQDVTTAADLAQALITLVQRVKKAIDADAVAVFLLDQKNSDYVLLASEGLVKDEKSIVRIPLDEGLIGLVGRREEPINIDNAHVHSEFHYSPMVNEDRLHGFLGVPIIQHRRLYGVICVQQESINYFDGTEEAFLITLAAQLGGIIAHAEATGELSEMTEINKTKKKKSAFKTNRLQGDAAVTGVAIGEAFVIYPPADLDAIPYREAEDIDDECAQLLEALKHAREDMEKLGQQMHDKVAEDERALFDVYLRILHEDSLGQEVIEVIQQDNLSAQAALSQVVKKHIQQFESMEDAYLRERASDFRDLGRRVLAHLQSSQKEECEYPEKTILVGDEIPASVLAEVPEGVLAGIVSSKGSYNSHVAILARALGVPSVMGVRGLQLDGLTGQTVIVDGYAGQVFLSPSRTLYNEFSKLAKEEHELNQSLGALRDEPAETTDGYRISLMVNTGLAMDAGLSMSVGAEGVGLYRSEVPFMNKDRFPSEDEQTIIYRQILKAFSPRPVTMRTLDIGGDKTLPYFPIEEDNPFLGWRGIRVTLDHPEFFLVQIRAMLRASEELNNLRILLPMISSLSEVDEAKYLLDQAFSELVEEGYNLQRPKIGAMIEVPAAAVLAKELGRRCDYISVGSNDLLQYLLAVDRNNARVASLLSPFHPAAIQTLLRIVEQSHAAGVEVSICGEMASDPCAVILLLAMGFDSLSMNSASLPRVKWVVRNFAIHQTRKILDDVLNMEHHKDIHQYLQNALVEAGLGGLIRAGKS
ncbi:phosphoenolpyruvate--protein phosphotransferase [Legionella sp. W05-934-2]|jgi:phosphotransferase system enzyme I (PtsP)|uniref:phosphoenolpyruvate--protein phosphotransferase n=1 Tax=Legionella sp. W05-934-2 TaxID=1198649 RepID=UPI003462B303